MEELKAWGFEFETDLVHVNGRVLPKQHIFFARGEFEIPNDKEEWTAAFRSKQRQIFVQQLMMMVVRNLLTYYLLGFLRQETSVSCWPKTLGTFRD
jgi:hypothetical protein